MKKLSIAALTLLSLSVQILAAGSDKTLVAWVERELHGVRSTDPRDDGF